VKNTLIATALIGALSLAQAETLIVASEPTFPPFEFQASKTLQYTGFGFDLIRAIGSEMGAELKISAMGFDAIIPSIQAKSVDIGMSSFTITEERKKRVLFSEPYYDSSLSILVKKSTHGVKTFEDLKNKVICVQIGTSGALRAKKIPGTTVKNFNSQTDAILELYNGGCVAVVGDRPVTDYFLTRNPKKAGHFMHVIVNEEVEQYGIIVHKDNAELMRRINAALAKLKANGGFQVIHRRWFGN